MELVRGNEALEALNRSLNDDTVRAAYMREGDGYVPALIPRVLARLLVACGSVVYGRQPSYMKFRAVEVIARVPYHSWSSCAYTLLTVFYRDEKKAMELSTVAAHARLAQDNETMHVVVISQLAAKEERAGVIRHTVIPMVFAFFYFWMSYVLALVKPRYSYELNYLFEQHAYEQYSLFLARCGDVLRQKTFRSDFLSWYGRHPNNQYEFFCSVRNDELVHRNQSLEAIRTLMGGRKRA